MSSPTPPSAKEFSDALAKGTFSNYFSSHSIDAKRGAYNILRDIAVERWARSLPKEAYEDFVIQCYNPPAPESPFWKAYDFFQNLEGRDFLEAIQSFHHWSREMTQKEQRLHRYLLEGITEEMKKVYIYDAFSFGVDLYDLIAKYPDTLFYLQSSPDDDEPHILDVCLPFPNVRHVTTNWVDTFIGGDPGEEAYEYDLVEAPIDYAIAVPIMGAYPPMEEQVTLSAVSEWMVLECLLNLVDDGGRLAIVLPRILETCGGNGETMRLFTQKESHLEKLSVLPTSTRVRQGSFNLAIYTFKKADLDTLRLEKLAEEEDSFVVDDEATVDQSQWRAQSIWDVGRYHGERALEDLHNTGHPVVALGDIAELLRGKSVAKTQVFEGAGNIAVIHLGSLGDTGILLTDVQWIPEEVANLPRYGIEIDDVLLACRGTNFKATPVRQLPYPSIASANLVIIRPGEEVYGTYLALFLRSALGRRLLESFRRGGGLINLNIKDLRTLPIPLPPLEVQRELAADYFDALDAYEQTIHEATTALHAAVEDVEDRLFSREKLPPKAIKRNPLFL